MSETITINVEWKDDPPPANGSLTQGCRRQDVGQLSQISLGRNYQVLSNHPNRGCCEARTSGRPTCSLATLVTLVTTFRFG